MRAPANANRKLIPQALQNHSAHTTTTCYARAPSEHMLGVRPQRPLAGKKQLLPASGGVISPPVANLGSALAGRRRTRGPGGEAAPPEGPGDRWGPRDEWAKIAAGPANSICTSVGLSKIKLRAPRKRCDHLFVCGPGGGGPSSTATLCA